PPRHQWSKCSRWKSCGLVPSFAPYHSNAARDCTSTDEAEEGEEDSVARLIKRCRELWDAPDAPKKLCVDPHGPKVGHEGERDCHGQHAHLPVARGGQTHLFGRLLGR